MDTAAAEDVEPQFSFEDFFPFALPPIVTLEKSLSELQRLEINAICDVFHDVMTLFDEGKPLTFDEIAKSVGIASAQLLKWWSVFTVYGWSGLRAHVVALPVNQYFTAQQDQERAKKAKRARSIHYYIKHGKSHCPVCKAHISNGLPMMTHLRKHVRDLALVERPYEIEISGKVVTYYEPVRKFV